MHEDQTILIDGGFFLKRLPKLVAPNRCESPQKIIACLRHMCYKHVEMLTVNQEPRWRQHLYRIFFYDAEPFDGKAHHPIDNRPIDFSKSEVARERHALFDLLRKERKLALRLGKVTATLCPRPNSPAARASNSSSIPSGNKSMQTCSST